VLELLADIDAEIAAAKPIPGVHSIWELVLHIAVWDRAAVHRLAGRKTQPAGKQNFPDAPQNTMASDRAAWRNAVSLLKKSHANLVRTVSGLPDARLRDRVPGKRYNFAFMLHGVVQHELYHAGQIAILKKTKPNAR
jgi:uncharacterized damage-inducible protein DinB